MCPPGYNYTRSRTAERFRIMRDAIQAQKRPILYSLCEWGTAGVQEWGNDTGASWRSTDDINATWPSILDLWNQNLFHLNHVDFWGHSDADMLEVGNGITIPESRTHFAFWAAMKSPLLIGTDLAKIGKGELEILKNKYLLAFNQDPVYGKPATPYKWGTNPDWTWNVTFPAEYWSGLSQQGVLVLMFNPYSDWRDKTAVWAEIPYLEEGESYDVHDIWTDTHIGCMKDSLTMEIGGHDTAALLITGKCKEDYNTKPAGSRLARGLRFLGDW